MERHLEADEDVSGGRCGESGAGQGDALWRMESAWDCTMSRG